MRRASWILSTLGFAAWSALAVLNADAVIDFLSKARGWGWLPEVYFGLPFFMILVGPTSLYILHLKRRDTTNVSILYFLLALPYALFEVLGIGSS
jgi:hypothetical protein